MACDTFIKIALKCRRHFVTVQLGEAMPFIEEILSTISSIICDLQTQQVVDKLFTTLSVRPTTTFTFYCNTYIQLLIIGSHLLRSCRLHDQCTS